MKIMTKDSLEEYIKEVKPDNHYLTDLSAGEIDESYFELPDKTTPEGREEYYAKREMYSDKDIYPKEHRKYYPELYHKMPPRAKIICKFTDRRGNERVEIMRSDNAFDSKGRVRGRFLQNNTNKYLSDSEIALYLKNRDYFFDKEAHLEMHRLYYPEDYVNVNCLSSILKNILISALVLFLMYSLTGTEFSIPFNIIGVLLVKFFNNKEYKGIFIDMKEDRDKNGDEYYKNKSKAQILIGLTCITYFAFLLSLLKNIILYFLG